MQLQGKVALVTGGGTGLGREIARQFAREGIHVAVNYSRSREEAEDTVVELSRMGIKARAIRADVGKPAEVAALVAETAEHFGRIDLLINNAATTKFVAFSDLDGLAEEDWDRMLAVNTKAPFFAARAVAPVMRQNGGGHIINTASIAGIRPNGSSLAYCVSKAGLIHLTACLALALGPDIRVNAVAPGLLLTRWGGNFGEDRIEGFKQRSPLKQVTSIEDTAALFVMLARNSSITGQTITVDAGLSLP